MKLAIFTIGLFLLTLGGCQSAPMPTPGMATLRVQVSAKPKASVVTGNTHVLSYDAPAAASSGQFEKVDYASLDDIVIWLEPVDGSTVNSSDVVTVELSAGKSAGELSIANVGETITFHNRGATSLNLYSVSDGNEFDLGSVPAGASAAYTVKSPGLIEVWTDSLKEPIAQVYAAPTKWVRLTHAGDTVEFTDLPPGHYKIASWHPRLPGQQISTTLLPNQVTSASINVGVNGLPQIDAR